jgi:hypothetical protein
MNYIGAALILVAVLAPAAWGATPTSLTLEWTPPTTNVDGTPLDDLAAYQIYVSSPCPGTTFITVPAAAPVPGPGVVETQLTGLQPSTTYTARVTAVDLSGNESPCSATATGTTLAQTPPTPATTLTLVFSADPLLQVLPNPVVFTWQRTAPLPTAKTVTITGGSGPWTTQDMNQWADTSGGTWNPTTQKMEFPATATSFTIVPSSGMLTLANGTYNENLTVTRGPLVTVITVRVTVSP